MKKYIPEPKQDIGIEKPKHQQPELPAKEKFNGHEACRSFFKPADKNNGTGAEEHGKNGPHASFKYTRAKYVPGKKIQPGFF